MRAHTTAFVKPVVEHWLEREIGQWVHHEGSIWQSIALWANAYGVIVTWIFTNIHLDLCKQCVRFIISWVEYFVKRNKILFTNLQILLKLFNSLVVLILHFIVFLFSFHSYYNFSILTIKWRGGGGRGGEKFKIYTMLS